MKNLWSDREAKAMVHRYARHGVGRHLALRVYTSRLLGGDPRLVLHGGGNTSVKTAMTEITGDDVPVLCVKGSGWDMGNIEPAGLPAVRLEPLRRLAGLDALSDEDMVNALRANLLDSAAPNPSVETLLHAFLPHRYVDHTHSNAVLALTNLPDGDAICRRVFGPTMASVPYIMPGFALARAAANTFQAEPSVEGMILLKHGIFTFGDTAKEAYGRMIAMVTRAEKYLKQKSRGKLAAARQPKSVASVAEVATVLRGLTAMDEGGGAWKRMILEFRGGKDVLAYVNGRDVGRYSQQGTATPDHVIRVKPKPLIAPRPDKGAIDVFAKGAARAVKAYQKDYRAYFARNNKRQEIKKTELDPMPRVILVPGLGLFGLGATAKAARVAADLAETNVAVITAAEGLGRFQCIGEADIFDIEYWSLEQAKLAKGGASPGANPLARQVAVVTGGGSGIGAAVVRELAARGAEVAVLDLNAKAAGEVAREIGGLGVACDVTGAASVRRAFDAVCEAFGGVDIVVSNAGAALTGTIGTVEESVLRKSFELNFWGHQKVAQNAVRVMKAQGTGGCLLFNTSKQAVNPGPDFGPYGLPKAATLFLMRQYAVDHGADGIRSNAVNADRIRSGLLTGPMIKTRSKARGLSEADYMSGNLLGREVTAQDVARAFADLAAAPKTTAAIITVDGGNIAAALR